MVASRFMVGRGLARRRTASSHRSRIVLRRRPGRRFGLLARSGRARGGRSASAHGRHPAWLAGSRAARGACGVVRCVHRLVGSPGPLVGLRKPHHPVRALRGSGALVGRTHARARQRARGAARRGDRVVAPRQGLSLLLRLRRPRRHTPARTYRSLESTRPRDRLRSRARACPSWPRGHAARVFGARRAPPHVLARGHPHRCARLCRLVVVHGRARRKRGDTRRRRVARGGGRWDRASRSPA